MKINDQARVRIYKPVRNAMQSGKGRKETWVIKFLSNKTEIDPVMGWVSSDNMNVSELLLRFSTKEDAIKFAINKNWCYEVVDEKVSFMLKPKSYANNFK